MHAPRHCGAVCDETPSGSRPVAFLLMGKGAVRELFPPFAVHARAAAQRRCGAIALRPNPHKKTNGKDHGTTP